MSYHFDSYDNSIVIDGFEQGIADSPYSGISDMRNVNVTSIKGEAFVNYATSQISHPPLAATLTNTSNVNNTVTLGLVGSNLDVGTAISFTSLSDTTQGISLNTPYWIKTNSSGTCTLRATPQVAGATVTITGNGVTGAWQTYNITSPKYSTSSNTSSGSTGGHWMVDNIGQVWTDIIVTVTNKYWTYTGNTIRNGGSGAASGFTIGNGLVYYQGSDGNGWLFVFSDSAIDYTPTLASTIAWNYGWNPASGTNNNSSGYLKSASNANNSHEALVGADNKVYYCDANWIGRWYQKIPTTGFVPTDNTTYVYDTTAVLPFNDIAQCLTVLGNNLIIGGQKNVAYPWDTFSQLPLYPIFFAENNILKLLTINTNFYALVGTRGRIYMSNGVTAQLFKKVPDHLSGTVEPYFTWGGITTNKNQLYVSLVATKNDQNAGTNAAAKLPFYGGLWAIDMDTRAIRLLNQLSYGSYAGYATTILPITTAVAGVGLYMGWDTQAPFRNAITDGVLNSTTTVTSATANFTSNDVGSIIAGTGIPAGAVITSVTNSTTCVINNAATTSSSGVTLTISSGFGIDQFNPGDNPYTGSQAYVDSDLIPIGTFMRTRNFERVEFRLSKPLVSGESISLYYRLDFSQTYTLIGTTNTAGVFSNSQVVNFKNAQWLQLRAVLNSTNTNPSYVRLREFRITGATPNNG